VSGNILEEDKKVEDNNGKDLRERETLRMRRISRLSTNYRE
jgi:hypothetical protein